MISPTSLPPQVLEENQNNLRRLRRQIDSSMGVVPFVGAGLSIPMGFLGWSDFLLTQALKVGPKTQQDVQQLLSDGRYEDAASLLLEARAYRAFEDAIYDCYGKDRLLTGELCGAVKLLPKIARNAVVTTNFDQVLETAYDAAGFPFEYAVWGARLQMANKALREDRHFLLKIHGDAEESSERVLTRDQYDQYYGPLEGLSVDHALQAVLRQIWQTRTVLFIGCSLHPDRTMWVLEQLAKEAREMAHYAIVEANPDPERLAERSKFLSSRGIRPIWYPAGQHGEVELLLQQLVTGTALPTPVPDGAEAPRVSLVPVVRQTEPPHQRYKLFVSCSWGDGSNCQLLTEKLRAAGYDPVREHERLREGQELNRSAVRAMTKAHGLITLLTSETLQHAAVREELVRANSLHIRSCAIVTEDAVHMLPWFVAGTIKVTGSGPNEITQAVDALIDQLESEPLSDDDPMLLVRSQLLAVSQLWKRDDVGPAVRDWQLGLARQLTENAAQELNSLHSRRYSSYVGRGHNFLLRATPVFEQAERVFAVSLDTVSEFWVSPDRTDQRIARNYWLAQPPRTQRLFVFSSPESAHNYATILNIHARKYGDTGRVYLCSRTVYDQLVKETGVAEDCDFAALEYATPDGPTTYVATLNAETFTINQEPAMVIGRQMEEFKLSMQRLETLRHGEVDTDAGIMRWQVDLQLDHAAWAGRLKTLFGVRRPDVIHMIFISRAALETSDVKTRLQAIFGDVRNTLMKLQEQHGPRMRLKDYWVGEAHQSLARDYRTRGQIFNEDANHHPMMLLMRFEDEEGLDYWYNDAAHSLLRRRIYELLDERLPELYLQMDVAPGQAEEIFKRVETIAAERLTRRDYLEADTIDDIVLRRPFRPPFSFQ